MKKISIVLATVALAGCAKDPSEIAAVKFPAGAYAQYSCEQLQQEWQSNETDLAWLSAKQVDAVKGDALGVFLIGVPIASMGGADFEGNIGNMKGRKIEIEAEQARKQCPRVVAS